MDVDAPFGPMRFWGGEFEVEVDRDWATQRGSSIREYASLDPTNARL